MIDHRLAYRDYGSAVIAAYSSPFSAALFTGGAADIFRAHIAGLPLEAIQKCLHEQFPDSRHDISIDIANVAAFFTPDSTDQLEDAPSDTGGFSPMSAIKLYARENHLLTNATIELNTRCNLRCEHCFHADFISDGLPLASIVTLLTELKALGVLFVCLTGGELFLRKDALAIIEAAHQLGFIVELKTNGTALTDGTISQLSGKRISDVQVSVYGFDDGYSEFTHSNYTFSAVARSIRNLTHANIPCSVAYQITPGNVAKLDDTYRTLSDLTDNLYFSYYVTPHLGISTKNFVSRLSYEQLRDVVFPKLRSWGMLPEPVRYRSKDCGYVCWAGHEQIFISSSGLVYPCADLKVPIGNLATESIADIARNRFVALSKFMPSVIPVCMTCEHYDFCDSCIGIAQIENGSFLKPSKHKCELSKLEFERG